MSTLVWGSPLERAFAAALAAAAEQAPVVQPVLSFSLLAFAMLGGMEGSVMRRRGMVGAQASWLALRNMCEKAGL